MRRWGVIGVLGVLLAGTLLLGGVGLASAQIPTEADVYVDRGILAYDARRFDEALAALEEALKIDPDNVNALYYHGLTQIGLNRLPAAQQSLERAHALAPGDLDVATRLAAVHFNQQQFDRAEPLFRQVHAATPKRQNLGYYLGFLEYRKQNYREALRFFRANVPSDADFAQLARFYAGMSLTALGFSGQARAEIEEAIRLQPVSPLTGPAERFRDVLGVAVKTERNYKLEAKVSFFYDDNVTANPSISNDPTVALAREKKSRSTGQLGFLRFEHQPLRTPDWEGTWSASILGSFNNDVTNYNVVSPSLNGGLAYKSTLAGRQAVWNLGLAYDYISLNDAGYTNRYTLSPALTYVWGPNQISQPLARLQIKDYLGQNVTTVADDRDAYNVMAGLTHFFLFEGGKHYLKVGYQFDYEVAEGRNWGYSGNRLLAGLQYRLPWWDLRLKYDVDLHLKGYRNQHSYLPLLTAPAIHRWDRDINSMVSLSKDLPYNVTVALEYLYNRNISNLELYDYQRNVVSMSLSWKY